MAQAKQRGAYMEAWDAFARELKAECGYRCVRCGEPHCRETWRVLTVHHFDGDKCNNERWNLMVLCQRCHLSIQARVDPAVAWIGPYSTWSLPYIAGFFATGRGIKPPGYELERWIEEYQAIIGPWPAWAPHVAREAVKS